MFILEKFENTVKCEKIKIFHNPSTVVPPSMVLLSAVSVTHCQVQYENIKWKIP